MHYPLNAKQSFPSGDFLTFAQLVARTQKDIMNQGRVSFSSFSSFFFHSLCHISFVLFSMSHVNMRLIFLLTIMV